MNWRPLKIAGVLICCLILADKPSLNPVRAEASEPELWVWLQSHLNNDANLDKTKKTIDQLSALGYNGVAFWDVSWVMLGSPNWGDPNGDYPKAAMNYAASKGMKVAALAAPFGYSNEILMEHPDWAEPQRIVGSRYRVSSDKTRLEIVNSFAGLPNGGFEDGQTAWFDKHDRGVGIDSNLAHSGKAAGVVRDAPGDGRFGQKIRLTPWRQYHIRLFARTENYKGAAPLMTVLDARVAEKVRYSGNLDLKPTQEWTEFNAVFNSQDSTDAYLFFGEWGGAPGALWFDDVSIEESAPVRLIRREGAPFRIYDPESGATFEEGKDYLPVKDPHPLGEPFLSDNAPIEIRLTDSTAMKPGRDVAIDYYAIQPISPPGEFGMCLTLPGVQKWIAGNARKIVAVSPPQGGVFLQYDEVRQANSCALCKSKKMTAGELLAWHVGETAKLYRSLRPDIPLYFWSDMFDPFHNAHNDYYLAEGDFANSWKGLPADGIVMNWNPERPKESLRWFSGRDPKQPVAFRQIISAYVDGQDGADAARKRLSDAHGVPGIIGIMYTTWSGDYSKLKAFADAVREKWPEYQAGLR